MRVAVPEGGLQIWEDSTGALKGSLKLQVHFDVVPTWIELALGHLSDAKGDSVARAKAWADNLEEEKATTLEREFRSSMQAIMSSAIALDAFYAALRERVKIDPALRARWRANGTARYRQLTEVIRVAFSLKPKGAGVLRDNLREIFKLRDLAVHPDATLKDPMLHPELGVGVEWRFYYFRFEQALAVVRCAVRMIHELVTSGKPTNPAVQEYAATLKPLFDVFKDSEVLSENARMH